MLRFSANIDKGFRVLHKIHHDSRWLQACLTHKKYPKMRANQNLELLYFPANQSMPVQPAGNFLTEDSFEFVRLPAMQHALFNKESEFQHIIEDRIADLEDSRRHVVREISDFPDPMKVRELTRAAYLKFSHEYNVFQSRESFAIQE